MKMMTILYSNCDLCHPTSLLLPLSPPHPHSDIRDVIVAVTFVDVGEDQRAVPRDVGSVSGGAVYPWAVLGRLIPNLGRLESASWWGWASSRVLPQSMIEQDIMSPEFSDEPKSCFLRVFSIVHSRLWHPTSIFPILSDLRLECVASEALSHLKRWPQNTGSSITRSQTSSGW